MPLMNRFSFSSENIEMPELDIARLSDWITRVAEHHGKIVGPISYIFCDDETILRVNREFLDHDYFTDIITFDYSRRNMISGDIYISLDTIRSNAEKLSQAYERELLRVVIHGVLHLCGINDKGPGEREIMEQNEDESLKMYEI